MFKVTIMFILLIAVFFVLSAKFKHKDFEASTVFFLFAAMYLIVDLYYRTSSL